MLRQKLKKIYNHDMYKYEYNLTLILISNPHLYLYPYLFKEEW